MQNMRENVYQPKVIQINSKLVGVTFFDRQKNVTSRVVRGQRLFFKREPDNQFDENAIIVYADVNETYELGHLGAALARKVVSLMDQGYTISLFCNALTGGKPHESTGVNVRVVGKI